MNRVRPPAVAGSFYPSNVSELNGCLDECFDLSPLGPRGSRAPSPTLVAGMVPHAGFVYSGPCAAHLYARLDNSVRRVILLGVNHWARGHRAAVSPWESWQTPLGQVSVDVQLQEFLESRVAFLKKDDRAHGDEHSIEVQLPFLQRVLEEFTFLPVSLSHLEIEECAELGAAIADGCRAESDSGVRTVVLASSDLSHYLSPKETEELDHLVLKRVVALDAAGLLEVVDQRNISMCGVLPAAVMLLAANALGASKAQLLKHCHSGDIRAMSKVVGYASVALEL